MNGAQFHLIFNHLPIAGMIFGLGFLTWGLISKTDFFKFSGLWLIFLSGIFIIPSYFTGDEAEEVVGGLSGVSSASIQSHEEFAKVTLIVVLITGIISGLSLFLDQKRSTHTRKAVYLTLALSLISSFFLGRVAQLGGLISHPELNESFVTQEIDEDD